MARESGAGIYQLLDRYRVQVRELAGHAALERRRALLSPEHLAVTAGDAKGDIESDSIDDDAEDNEMASEGPR